MRSPGAQRFKVLSKYKTLQGEEHNPARINDIIDINTMQEAKNITVNQINNSQVKNLSNIFYRQYLEPNMDKRNAYSNIDDCISWYKFDGIKSAYSRSETGQENLNFYFLRINEGKDVKLFIKNIPENGELVIPSEVYDKNGNEYKVTSFEKDPTFSLKRLKKLTITGNFDNLKINPFSLCRLRDLTTVEIDGIIKNLKIESNAFSGCNKLTEFKIQASVTDLTIEFAAFANCAIKEFTISDSVKNLTIGNSAFANCAIKEFTIPASVTNLTIGAAAFANCAIKEFTIPASVTNLTIGNTAFNNCRELNAFTILASVKNLTIGNSAFSNCAILKEFTIPASVKNMIIRNEAFDNCAIKEFTIQKGEIENLIIANTAFDNCAALTKFEVLGKIKNLIITDADYFPNSNILRLNPPNLEIKNNINILLKFPIILTHPSSQIFLPNEFKSNPSLDFNGDNRIIYYNIKGETISLNVDTTVNEISVDERTLFMLKIAIDTSYGLTTETVELNNFLQGEFSKIEDTTKFHYIRN